MRLVAMKIQQKDSTEKKKEIEKQKLTIRIKPHESGNQITFHISWLQQITRCCYVSVSKSLKLFAISKKYTLSLGKPQPTINIAFTT